MFAKVRNRLGESFGKNKPAAAEAAVEKKAEEGQAEDTLVTQISSLEELVNKRTQELKQARAHLNQLTNNDSQVKIEEDGDKATQTEGFFTQPNQTNNAPPGKPEEETKEAKDQSPIMAKDQETEAKKEETPVEATTEATTEAPSEAAATPAGAEDDSFSNLFSQEEEEENPLAGLISSLPDATATELLNDVHEIQKMMQQWQAHEQGEKT